MFKAEGKMAEISPQQIISCDTTDDDCNGGDLLTVFNYVMGAESIDCDVDYTKSSNEGCGGSGLQRKFTSSDQSSLQIESGYETGRFVLVQGGCAFSSAYHSRSQVVQIQQGARDDQQSHYSAEGGGLGRMPNTRICVTLN